MFDSETFVNMFEIVKVKLIQCAFKVKKKYLDVSRLQLLYHQRMIELKTKENKILTKNKIDHSTVFSTFDMDKLRKSVDTTGKSALILGKLPSLKVIRLKRAKRELHKASKIYKRLYRGGVGGWGGGGASSPYKRLGVISSLLTGFSKSLSNLAALLILRRSFQWCRRIITNLSMSKVKKP